MGIQGKNRRVSIFQELVIWLVCSAVISLGLFGILNRSGAYFIEQKFEGEEFVAGKNQEAINKLKAYVTENRVSVHDRDMLNRWMEKNSLVSIQIFKDKKLQYDSSYPDIDYEALDNDSDYYDWMDYYTVEFSDGEADVFIVSFYSYRYYTVALIIEIILAFLCFIILVLAGISRRIQYIRCLERDIRILEGGDLDYEIKVSGRDEIAELATGLNEMRQSLKQQMEQEVQVYKSNQRLVTEMSHDLRTPLTSLMLCTELLKQKKYQNEDQLKEYVEKIENKAKQIKVMSDHLFEYALTESKKMVDLQPPEQFRFLFYDMLSDVSMYLEERGIHTENCFENTDARIQVNLDYTNRILDNLISNLLKYADKKHPVLIRSKSDGGYMILSFENVVNETPDNVESTKIGLMNVRNMMESMRGECRIKRIDDRFEISLYFPIVI